MLTFLAHLIVIALSPNAGRLAATIQKQAPTYLTEDSARAHVVAATLASTQEIPAELLLGMAYVESRYTPLATSRVEGDARKTGVPLWESPPSNVHGPYFCGVTQAEADSWKKCQELRDILVAYRTTVHELTLWLQSPYCRTSDNRMQCALWGYGGGHPAIQTKTSTYPSRVLSRAAAIRRSAAPSS